MDNNGDNVGSWQLAAVMGFTIDGYNGHHFSIIPWVQKVVHPYYMRYVEDDKICFVLTRGSIHI